MYRLENEHLAVTIAPHGGELQSLIHREREYLWQGDARYWGRRAPVLFPIVGKLKDGRYHYHGHEYTLPQHGFARDQDFHLIEHDEHSLTYRLEDSGESGEHYPFAFILDLSYTLRGDTLRVGWHVHNPGEQELLFSIGGHPAFNLPLADGDQFSDHIITLDSPGIAQLGWQDGLLDPAPRAADTAFALNYEQFANDALIYHTPGATRITLRGKTPAPVLTVSYSELPYLGLWTPAGKEAPFLCIEPWAGVMDSATHDGDLETKLGIQRLAAHADWQRHYDIRIHDEAQP